MHEEVVSRRLQRFDSDVHAFNPNGSVIRNFVVWSDKAPAVKASPDLLFAMCLVLPGSTSKLFKLKQISPEDSQEFTALPSHVWNSNAGDSTERVVSCRDIGLLGHQNIPSVLHFLKTRWENGCIYTTADPLLVAVNPFRDLKNCTEDQIEKYKAVKMLGDVPPHVFAVARAALNNLAGVGKSQSIIVTGESGAGKTEATKHCLRYLAGACRVGSDCRVQTAVMAANPVLEAFGNAKTIMNNNSSRFGRFMQLAVSPSGGILNAQIQSFLLEKVRVVSLQNGERSFHVFYQLLKGADADERRRFSLGDLTSYAHLRTSGPEETCYDVPGVNDRSDFLELKKSFRSMGFSEEELKAVFCILSGILRLGNVKFEGRTIEGVDNAAELDAKNTEILGNACSLMCLENVCSEIGEAMKSSEKLFGQALIKTRLRTRDAVATCHSMMKAVYSQLFKWIIKKVNAMIQPLQFDLFIGMLDIFGFEIFKCNSLEQLLINITNEFLQKNFINIIFEKESKLYRQEGISTEDLTFSDNKAVVDCLIGKQRSVFALVEDACVTRGGTDEALYSNMNRILVDRTAYKPASMGAKSLNFTIAHTVAKIEYSTKGFVSKNMDFLKAEIVDAIKKSPSAIMQAMFADVEAVRGSLGKGHLMASQFLQQLDAMMKIITSTETHFVRCIRPNNNKSSTEWSNSMVMNQLQSLSVLEALQLKKLGYCWRRSFREFVQQFRFLGLQFNAAIQSAEVGEDQRRIAEEMMAHIARGLPKESFSEKKDWQFGKTMVFLTTEASQILMARQRQALEDWIPAVNLIEALYRKQMLRRAIRSHEPALVRVQANIRRYLDCMA